MGIWLCWSGLGCGFVINNGSELDGQYAFADFAKSSRIFHVPVAELLAAKTTLAPGKSPELLSWAKPSEFQIPFDHDNDTSTTAIAL